MTKNFKISEFLESKFYDSETQQKVIKEYNQNKEVQYNIQKLANQLQVLRDYLGVPVNINIAFRPVFYELSKGRSGKSQHTLGKAADITAAGLKPKYIAKVIEQLINEGEILQGGIGIYSTFVHYDIRKRKARW